MGGLLSLLFLDLALDMGRRRVLVDSEHCLRGLGVVHQDMHDEE
jgi:hypothetical protein